MSKSVTLEDIAKRLGVSTVTVSNALGGKKGVSSKMREKIMQTADEMGYVKEKKAGQGINAAGLRLGVVVCQRYLEGGLTFYWELYQKVAAQSSGQGCFTVLEVLKGPAEMAGELPQTVTEKRIDGLMIMGPVKKDYLALLKEKIKVPMLFMDFYDADVLCDAVISNGFIGMYRMTNLLFRQGFQRIAFVGNILATSSIMDRYQGYVRALLEHGVEERSDWIISDRDMQTGQVHVMLPEEMPEAFVCNCDYTAEILVEELEQQGYRVPEDISIVGYDDFLHFGKMQDHLTTYRVDQDAMAELGVRILIERIAHGGGPARICSLEGQVVLRDSVRRK